jgi:hypothetical protein
MFGSNLALPRGGILSYEQALQKFNSIVPIRGRNVDTRPVAQRRNDNFTIRLAPRDQSVIIRLYHTDIITYNVDGTIDLEPYASRLTNDAVSGIFRGAVQPQYTSPVGPVLWARADDGTKRGYYVPDFATLDKDLCLIAGSKPFTRYKIDRKASNQACQESGFNQFALWLRTQVRLGLDPRQGGRWAGQSIGMGVTSCLDEVDRYPDIVRDWSTYANVDTQLAALRLKVQKNYDAVTTEEVPYVSDWQELTSIAASKRRLG